MPATGITIFDIAREAGVSIATVSRALSEQYNPRSAKQRRVLEVAQKYNYIPSVAARSLGGGRSKLLTIVMPQINNPFYSTLYSYAEAEASLRGYTLLLQKFHDKHDRFEVFRDAVISRRPDGLIVSGGLVEDPVTDEKIRVLEELGRYMPIVTLGRHIDHFTCVSVHSDLVEAAAKMVRHFHALGHRRIAMVGGAAQARHNNDREQGYDGMMQALGLTPQFDDRRQTGHTPQDGVSGVLRMFSAPRGQWPTALLATNDLVALGAIRQLDEMGLRVPEDVAVAGCDNQFFSAYTHPPLTTLDLNLPEQGRLAIHYVLNHRPGVSFHHKVDSTLVLRESCGAQRILTNLQGG